MTIDSESVPGVLQSADDKTSFAPTRPVKRSFSIAGHRTSVSLEAAFWDALKTVAADQERSLSSLVAEIDRERGDAGLSGAIRVWILDHYRNRTDLERGTFSRNRSDPD